jgi:hypothetical protein
MVRVQAFEVRRAEVFPIHFYKGAETELFPRMARMIADSEQSRIFYTKVAKHREAPLERCHQTQEQHRLEIWCALTPIASCASRPWCKKDRDGSITYILFADIGWNRAEQSRIFYTKVAKHREAPLELCHQTQEQHRLEIWCALTPIASCASRPWCKKDRDGSITYILFADIGWNRAETDFLHQGRKASRSAVGTLPSNAMLRRFDPFDPFARLRAKEGSSAVKPSKRYVFFQLLVILCGYINLGITLTPFP